MLELLAPAGSVEALYAAVYEGANAVYLAGNFFGARAYAKNFDDDALKNAVKYAHLHNVAVHVTVNTIVDDSEFDKLREYLRFLEEIGADAVLVQDLGVAKIVGEVAPNLPIHASTQMTVHNLDGAFALQKLGFSRVVLSRELTLKEIRHIVDNTDVEIEIFMHGALCVSYSGACLMSSMIGGRSGNRGRCAQPCRLPYTLVDENDKDVLQNSAGNYLLSPRDLATIDILPELISAGVSSFKIEGRMKSPEYVATVVRVYRAAIDRAIAGNYFVDESDKKDLRQIFNRDFTTAYLKGDYPGKDFMSDKKPNNRGLLIGRVIKYADRTVSVKLSNDLRIGDVVEFWVKVGGRVSVTLESLLNEKNKTISEGKAGDIVKFKIPSKVSVNDRVFKVRDSRLTELSKAAYESAKRIEVTAEVTAKIGEPLTVKFTDNLQNIGVGKTKFLGEAAKNRPLTFETVHKQAERLGDTVFTLKNLNADIEDNVMIPISEINEARRNAIAELERNRIKNFNLPVRVSRNLHFRSKINSHKTATQSKLLVRADNFESVKASINSGADGVIFGSETYNHRTISLSEYEEVAKFAKGQGKEIYFSTPRIVKSEEEAKFEKLLKLFDQLEPDGVYFHNIGQIYRAKLETNLPIYTDFSLIAYNLNTLEFLRDYGVYGATLSEELTLEQIKGIVKKSTLPLEIIIHGRAELMISNYCVLGTFLGGRGEKPCSMPCVKARYFLKDRMNEKFPIVTDEYCRMRILNAKTRSMLPYMSELAKLPLKLRIDGRYEQPKNLGKIVSAYKKATSLTEDAARELENSVLNAKDITRGHFFRGVL